MKCLQVMGSPWGIPGIEGFHEGPPPKLRETEAMAFHEMVLCWQWRQGLELMTSCHSGAWSLTDKTLQASVYSSVNWG